MKKVLLLALAAAAALTSCGKTENAADSKSAPETAQSENLVEPVIIGAQTAVKNFFVTVN